MPVLAFSLQHTRHHNHNYTLVTINILIALALHDISITTISCGNRYAVIYGSLTPSLSVDLLVGPFEDTTGRQLSVGEVSTKSTNASTVAAGGEIQLFTHFNSNPFIV